MRHAKEGHEECAHQKPAKHRKSARRIHAARRESSTPARCRRVVRCSGKLGALKQDLLIVEYTQVQKTEDRNILQ